MSEANFSAPAGLPNTQFEAPQALQAAPTPDQHGRRHGRLLALATTGAVIVGGMAYATSEHGGSTVSADGTEAVLDSTDVATTAPTNQEMVDNFFVNVEGKFNCLDATKFFNGQVAATSKGEVVVQLLPADMPVEEGNTDGLHRWFSDGVSTPLTNDKISDPAAAAEKLKADFCAQPVLLAATVDSLLNTQIGDVKLGESKNLPTELAQFVGKDKNEAIKLLTLEYTDRQITKDQENANFTTEQNRLKVAETMANILTTLQNDGFSTNQNLTSGYALDPATLANIIPGFIDGTQDYVGDTLDFSFTRKALCKLAIFSFNMKDKRPDQTREVDCVVPPTPPTTGPNGTPPTTGPNGTPPPTNSTNPPTTPETTNPNVTPTTVRITPKTDTGTIPTIPGAPPAESDKGTPGEPGVGPAGQTPGTDGVVPGAEAPVSTQALATTTTEAAPPSSEQQPPATTGTPPTSTNPPVTSPNNPTPSTPETGPLPTAP